MQIQGGHFFTSASWELSEVKMSFKGFQKTIIRAPQSIKYKLNLGEQTKDPVYTDAERRFQELETETKKLHDESKRYFEAINAMMNHQIEFSQAIAEIYKPISGRLSDPNSLIQEGSPEGIKACEDYEAIVKDLMATIQPELEMIETRIVTPANELLDIIKVIRKTALKRQHKQLDYDRHRATFKKLQEKKDKTLKDEQAIYKAENELEQSTQEYNYYNNLLKDELPKLFSLEREFIKPLFQSFYYMQLNIFYTLHEKMQGCDIGYFNLQLGIEEGFEFKRSDIRERAESLSITKFKTTGAKRPPRIGPKLGAPTERLAIESSKPAINPAIKPLSLKSPQQTDNDQSETPPPPYSAQNSPMRKNFIETERNNSVNGERRHFVNGECKTPINSDRKNSISLLVKTKGPAPPPPKPKPARLNGSPVAETVTALYDYEAQAEGDLSFKTGEIIEVVTRTKNENEWWVGKVKGRQGQFPGMVFSIQLRDSYNTNESGNYVRVN